MRYSEIVNEAAIPTISPQESRDKEMWGPFYHGTIASDLATIITNGPDVSRSIPSNIGISYMDKPIGTSNGYPLTSYGLTGIAAPVHHLGFGFYGTTVKAIAKRFAGGTMKGQREFYLDSKNVLDINFGAENTMMKWWLKNGYDMTSEATKNRDVKKWIAAAHNLTNTLKSQYDAVWFKGKGIRKLLDGDQLCVYNTDLIRVVDPKMATGLQIGSKVIHTQVFPSQYKNSNRFYIDNIRSDDWGSAGQLAGQGWRGIFRGDESDEEIANRKARGAGRFPVHFIPPQGMVGTIVDTINPNGMYEVKWPKGGVKYNYRPDELQPYVKPTR